LPDIINDNINDNINDKTVENSENSAFIDSKRQSVEQCSSTNVRRSFKTTATQTNQSDKSDILSLQMASRTP